MQFRAIFSTTVVFLAALAVASPLKGKEQDEIDSPGTRVCCWSLYPCCLISKLTAALKRAHQNDSQNDDKPEYQYDCQQYCEEHYQHDSKYCDMEKSQRLTDDQIASLTAATDSLTTLMGEFRKSQNPGDQLAANVSQTIITNSEEVINNGGVIDAHFKTSMMLLEYVWEYAEANPEYSSITSDPEVSSTVDDTSSPQVSSTVDETSRPRPKGFLIPALLAAFFGTSF